MSASTTARLLTDHLRAGFRASLLIAFLVTVTVFAVALVPRTFAQVSTAEFQYQLAQQPAVHRDLSGDGTVALPDPPRTGEVTLDTVLGGTDFAISDFRDKIPQPLVDGAGTPVWLLKSPTVTARIPGIVNPELSVRLAIDLKWTDRITFVEGAQPTQWVFDESVDPENIAENPIEIALSSGIAAAMDVSVGDILEYTPAPLIVTGIYEPVDPDDNYWNHAFDLQRPAIIRSGGEAPRILATAFIAPESVVSLQEPFSLGLLSVWIPIDSHAYSFADAEELAAQVRTLTASPLPLPGYGTLNLRSTFTDVVESTQVTVAVNTALIALAGSGLLGVLLATYALSIQALIRRRRPALSLASARGASIWQLRLVMVMEAALIALPGSAIGIVAAALLLPERVGLDSWLAPVLLAVVPIALAAILVAPGSLRESRQDISVRSTSAARWVLEAAVVGAAVISVVLLQRRGLVASADTVGVDPLLVATPALLAAAVGLLALRVFPIPLRALRALVRRGAAPVAEVGSARAVREPAIGAIATLTLIVGVAIAVFSTILIGTVATSMERAAVETVGADLQITAHDLPDALVDEIQGLPGVTGAVAIRYQANELLSDDAGGFKVGIVLVDPAALAAVRPDLPKLGQLSEGAYPVLVSQTLSERIQGTDLQLIDTAVVPTGVVVDATLPGLGDRWLIIDEAAVPDLGLDSEVPSRVLVGLESGYGQDAVDTVRNAVLSAQPDEFVRSARVTDVKSELETRRESPIIARLELSLIVVTGATLLLTMLIVALAATASAASRNRVVGVLRIIGMSPRQIRGLVAWEFGPVAAAALLVGTALGIGLPYLVTAVLDLRAFFGGISQPSPSLDVGWIAIAVGVYAVTVVAAVLVATALGRRFAPASTLKMGES